MATVEVAQAVGPGDEVGSPEAGKQADLIRADLTALDLSPVLETTVRDGEVRIADSAHGQVALLETTGKGNCEKRGSVQAKQVLNSASVRGTMGTQTKLKVRRGPHCSQRPSRKVPYKSDSRSLPKE